MSGNDRERWGVIEIYVEIDLPRDVYEWARDRGIGPDDVEGGVLDAIAWDFRYTVEGEPVDDLPAPENNSSSAGTPGA